MRLYTRLLKKIYCGKTIILPQSFITFKPDIDHIHLNIKINSPVINSLINNNKDKKMVFGLASYETPKIWIAPYGTQLEFLNTLQKTYVPFMDTKFIRDRLPGILHYIGYFPNSEYHQLYYYLGKNSIHVDTRLHNLQPDYYGISRTYDKDWNPIKTNSFAVRVPFSNAYTIACKEISDLNFITKPQYLNLSYRQDATSDDFTISWLNHDTTKINHNRESNIEWMNKRIKEITPHTGYEKLNTKKFHSAMEESEKYEERSHYHS
jgi:hypothetical protein